MKFEGHVLLKQKKQAKMQTIQKNLVTSLASMSLLSNKLLQLSPIIGKSNLSELKILASDSMALTSSANRKINIKRRENMRPDLQPGYKLLFSNQVHITSKLFGDNLQSDMAEVKNASRLIQSLKRSYKPQTPQTSITNVKHKINNNTKQGKPFLEKSPRRYEPHRKLQNIKLQSG